MEKARMARNDAGTTMVELVIALAVFMAGGVALMGGLVTLTTHSNVADERARATNFARSTFEDLRGRTVAQILAYDIPVDNGENGTVTIAGIGNATPTAFALLPDGQGGIDTFQLGVDDASGLDLNNLPNPLEIRLVLTPYRGYSEGGEQGGYSTINYASTTMIAY